MKQQHVAGRAATSMVGQGAVQQGPVHTVRRMTFQGKQHQPHNQDVVDSAAFAAVLP